MYRATAVFLAMLMTIAAGAQTAEPAPQPTSQPAAAQETPAKPAAPVDPAQQMQLDLDRMESLVNNMSAQVSFIHDTNMSILLNTNVQLWNVLIRDLRMQMQAQKKGATSEKPPLPQRH